jgi:hypothetical protein
MEQKDLTLLVFALTQDINVVHNIKTSLETFHLNDIHVLEPAHKNGIYRRHNRPHFWKCECVNFLICIYSRMMKQGNGLLELGIIPNDYRTKWM